jgi:hypothetical protein
VKARLLLVLVLGVALAAVPTVASGDPSRAAANSTTFPDSIGEDSAAPDITSVVVSNDNAGAVTFQINVSNRPAFTEDMYFVVFLDTDRKSTTGDPSSLGADYAIELDPGSVVLLQWNGSGYTPASSQASLTYSYSTAGATIRVRAVDLGKTTGFNFGVIAASGYTVDANGNGDFSNVHRDYAPDAGHGLNSYQVIAKLILRVTGFTVAPKPALAGRRFSVSLAASENDTNGPVATGTVVCAASIAGKRLVAVTHAVRNGIAVCVWRIPAIAKGQTVRGLITLTVRGTSVTRGFSARVA